MRVTATASVDPITTQVIRNALIAAAEEMRVTIVKTAYSPLIYEIQDFAVALFSKTGELLAQGTSMPMFLGAMPFIVEYGLEKFGAEGFRPGDILIANDPSSTGTHISDTAIYMPIFYDGELQAFSASMAHWADVGGKTPGGWCPDSTDVFQEGLILRHLKLYDEGRLNQTLYDLIMDNNRFPQIVQGDLNAQIAAGRTATKRYTALCAKYGAPTLRAAMDTVISQSEARMRRMISAMPDGEWSAESALDHDGVNKERQRQVKVTVRIAGDELTVDMSGSDEIAGGPINLPRAGAVSAVEIAFKSATLPHEPHNAGYSRPLKIVTPADSLVNPAPQSPCDSYGYVALLITDLVSEALSNAVPERCPAGEYMLCAPYFFRLDPRQGPPFIYVDVLRGGGGALPFDDGANALVFHGDGDAPDVPVEVAETRFPIRIERYTLHTAEYGIGKYRGGFGVVRDTCMLTDNVSMQMSNELTKNPPHGLRGGENAGINRVVAWLGSAKETVMTERTSYYGPFHRGDLVSYRTGGGAGIGDPLERDPQQVCWEVLNELLTAEQARDYYGVVLTDDAIGDPVVDVAATEDCRMQRRSAQAVASLSAPG
jgi:N-methylhydantoinase B